MAFETVRTITTDLLVIGGGAAGCMAAIMAKRRSPQLSVTILEKAHISRSGCLAMGLNAVNAYLTEGTPADYLDCVVSCARRGVEETETGHWTGDT